MVRAGRTADGTGAVPRNALQNDLERLRAELAATRELDPETRASLATLAEDIEQLLAAGVQEEHTIPERLRAAALQFEAEHPRLARILTDVTDALAKLGV